jgi:hypothetical protein
VNACAARIDPPTVIPLVVDDFIARTASGSKRRSSRVFAVETASNVVE